jgi:hypothetical protein
LFSFGALLLAIVFLYGSLLSQHALVTHERADLYLRVQQYADEFRHGFLQPQLFPDVMRGAGMAFPLFYPPLSYYLATLIHLLTGSAIVGINLSFFLSVVMSAVGVYLCAYSPTRRSSVAVFTSIFSICVTYRFVNIFVRGALAESWGTACYPFALYGMLEHLRFGRRGWYVALALAAAILSHAVVALYFVTLFARVAAVIAAGERRWRRLATLALYAIAAVGLAAWYIIPQQAYLKSVLVSNAAGMGGDIPQVQSQKIEFWQLFDSDPSRWFGASVGGGQDGMCFALGFGYAITAVLFVGFVYRQLSEPSRTACAWPVYGFAGACACTLLFMLFPKSFLGLLPHHYTYLQYPWRLLSVLPVFAGPLAACCADHLDRRAPDWSMLVVAILLVAEVPSFYHSPRLTFDFDAGHITGDAARAQGDRGLTDLAEYMPREYVHEPGQYYHIEQPESQNCQVLDWKREEGLTRCTVRVQSAAPRGQVTLPVTYYQFWHVSAGPPDVKMSCDRGFLRLDLPAGNTNVEIRRHYTTPYNIGWAVTGVSAVMLFAAEYLQNRKRRANGAGLS